MRLTVEIQRFKPSGKWYDTTTREVEVGADAHYWTVIDKLRLLQEQDEMIWLVTGEGMPNDVPQIIKRWDQR